MGIVDRHRTLWGTYLRGIFDNGRWRRDWLNQIRLHRQLAPITIAVPDYSRIPPIKLAPRSLY
jgi:adenosylcobyric acid synthase